MASTCSLGPVLRCPPSCMAIRTLVTKCFIMCREEFYLNQAEEAGYSLAPGRGPEGDIKVFTCQYSFPLSCLFCLKHSLVDLDKEETPGFQKRNLESIESEPGISHSVPYRAAMSFAEVISNLGDSRAVLCTLPGRGPCTAGYVGLWLNNDLDRGVFLFIPVAV